MVWMLASIGQVFLNFLATTGRLILFLIYTLTQAVQPPYYFRQILRQFWEIGYLSLPVIGLTAFFTGMVPISAAIAAPIRPDIIKPARTGPSSRVIVRTTTLAIALSALKRENPV